MKSILFYFKFLLLTSSLTWSIFSFAAPVSWELSFFDNSGLVGNGQFTYDPTTTSPCIVASQSPAACEPNPLSSTGFVDGIKVHTQINSIRITIHDSTWGYYDAFGIYFWWAEPTTSPGMQLNSKMDTWLAGRWVFLDDPIIQSKYLFLSDFTQNSTTSWSGSWDMKSYDNVNTRGSFMATTTIMPVPGTLLLFISGLLTLWWKQKIS